MKVDYEESFGGFNISATIVFLALYAPISPSEFRADCGRYPFQFPVIPKERNVMMRQTNESIDRNEWPNIGFYLHPLDGTHKCLHSIFVFL